MAKEDAETNCFISSVSVDPGAALEHAPKGSSRLKGCTVILEMNGDPTEAIRAGRFNAAGWKNWSFGPLHNQADSCGVL